jgi:hypothetical protein
VDVALARIERLALPFTPFTPRGAAAMGAEIVIVSRGIDARRRRVRLAAIRVGGKNGNAPYFSGQLEPTSQGSVLTGTIRFSPGARLGLAVMFLIPVYVLARGLFDPAHAPPGGVGFPLIVLTILTAFVIFFAHGAVAPTTHLRDWLTKSIAA